MSSFKKQAIKLKESFKEKGFAVPLVSVQEALARSYGFNNRHIALQKEKYFDELFAKLHKSHPIQAEAYPSVITKESSQSVNLHFIEEGDDDGYTMSFDFSDDIDFFDTSSIKDGHKLYIYAKITTDLKLNEIIDTKDIDVDDLFETWEWHYDIENFVAQLLAKAVLNQEEYLDEDHQQLPNVSFSKFLVDKEALQKAWFKVMKCFSIDGEITAHGIDCFKKTEVVYQFDLKNKQYVLIKK